MLPRLDPRSARRGRPARWHCRLRGLHCTGSPLTSKKLHRQPGVVAASSQEKPYPGRFRVGPVAQIGRKIDIVAQRSIASIQMRMNAARRAPKSRQDVRHIRGMSGAVAGAVSPRGRTAVTCRISSGRREAPLYGRPNSSSPPRRTNPPGRSCARAVPAVRGRSLGLLPLPACGERVGVRGSCREFVRVKASSPGARKRADLSPQAGRGGASGTAVRRFEREAL